MKMVQWFGKGWKGKKCYKKWEGMGRREWNGRGGNGIKTGMEWVSVSGSETAKIEQRFWKGRKGRKWDTNWGDGRGRKYRMVTDGKGLV